MNLSGFTDRAKGRGSSGRGGEAEDIAMTATALPTRSAPLGRMAARYWTESRQPLASLIFIAPLLVIYEVGVLTLGASAVRNGADAWLRQLLDQVGFSQYFLLPVLTVGILLAWHYLTRHPWRLSGNVFYGMIGECAVLSICLRLLLQLQGLLLQTVAGAMSLNVSACAGLDDRLPRRRRV